MSLNLSPAPDKVTIKYDDVIGIVLVRQDWMTDDSCWHLTVQEIQKAFGKWEPPPSKPEPELIDTGKIKSTFSVMTAGGGAGGSGNVYYNLLNEEIIDDMDSILDRIHLKHTHTKYNQIGVVNVGDIHKGEVIGLINGSKVYTKGTGYWLIEQVLKERIISCSKAIVATLIRDDISLYIAESKYKNEDYIIYSKEMGEIKPFYYPIFSYNHALDLMEELKNTFHDRYR